MDGSGWLWMALDACRSFWVVSNGFQLFRALVAALKFVALKLKEVDHYGESF